MADNIQLNTGSGGDVFAADDISGVKYQRTKLVHGADGTNDGDVSTANPLPANIQPAKLFSTTSLLGSGATYDSTVLDMRDYSQVQTHVTASHDGTMIFDFCSDAGGTDIVRSLTVPYVAADGFQLFAAPCFSDYVRYRFTNDAGVTQTDFLFETKVLSTALQPQLLRADGFVSPSMVSQLTRSVLVGQDSNSAFRNTGVDTRGNLEVSIANPRTAFGDLRVAELTPQAHLTFPYGINTDIVTKTEANSGTVTQADSMVVLQTSTNAAGSAIVESVRVLTYRSGLGALARFTGLFTTGVASSTQIIGVGDASDGFFFGYNGTAFGILRRQNGSDSWIAQTAWNVDTMDGNGPSGMTLDQTKLNVFQIQYQWLGAGDIEFFIEDPTTGLFTPVHVISYANANTVPSVYNASLPLYAQAINAGNTSNLTLKSASMAAFTEGPVVRTGPTNTSSNSSSHTGEAALFHLRNKSTYLTLANRVRCFLHHLSTANDVNQLATFRIYRNATLGGVAAYSDVNGNDSVMEVDTDQTYTSGGRLLFSGSVGKDTGQIFELTDLDIIVAPGDVITVTSDSGGTGLMSADLIWREDF